jgi:hypothetical protein
VSATPVTLIAPGITNLLTTRYQSGQNFRHNFAKCAIVNLGKFFENYRSMYPKFMGFFFGCKSYALI